MFVVLRLASHGDEHAGLPWARRRIRAAESNGGC